MEISDDVLCLFSAQVTEQDGSYVIEIPQRELSLGEIDEDGIYRVALTSATPSRSEETEKRKQVRDGPEPPVEEGEQRTVEIVDIGEQGDGIARVERGYVLIVPGTEMHERVTVRIADVKENLAFTEVIRRDEYYQ